MAPDIYAELFDKDLEAVGSAVDEKISDVVKLSSRGLKNGVFAG
ncbi:hypothetical protein [Corynebacterium macginleyi]|nr:hypothetical protein [Corynebacterium macginleyi]